jgi:DNA polymerase elongation subunit (family B)
MATVLEELARLIEESERSRLERIRRELESGGEIIYQDADSIFIRLKSSDHSPSLKRAAAPLLRLSDNTTSKKES